MNSEKQNFVICGVSKIKLVVEDEIFTIDSET